MNNLSEKLLELQTRWESINLWYHDGVWCVSEKTDECGCHIGSNFGGTMEAAIDRALRGALQCGVCYGVFDERDLFESFGESQCRDCASRFSHA